MRPGDRLVCAFVDRFETGHQFKDWHLHVTVVPWFRLDIASKQIAAGLQSSYVDSHPFEIHVGEEAQFGYKKTKTVNLVSAPELPRLEGQPNPALPTLAKSLGSR